MRILDGATATAARTRVIIDSQDGSQTWSTMGSDTNIIAASAQALADSLEFAIWKRGAEVRAARRAALHHGAGRARLADRATGAVVMTAVHLERWTVTSGSNANSRAAVVIRGGSHDWKASAEGNGPVDALYRAVDRALADLLDGGHPQLLAYDVHALAEGPSAEGKVTVRHRAARLVARAPPGRTVHGQRREPQHDRGLAGGVRRRRSTRCSPRRRGSGRPRRRRWSPPSAASSGAGGTTETGGAEWDDEAKPIDVNEWFNT